MALSVDIEKNLGSFRLRSRFETGDETLALCGASGCGKSMTLKCIAGILRPDKGKIVLNGRTLFDSEKHIDLPPQKRRVGYLFQQYALFPNLTVEQNIAVALKGRSKEERGRIVAEKVRAFHLEGLEKHRPAQLSGGQQQRTALARIMASEPEILLLDEPFSALDSELRFHMENEVRQAIRDFRQSVILVTHNRGEAYRLADRIASMEKGAILSVLPKKEWIAASNSVIIQVDTAPENIIVVNGGSGAQT